jgi:hypothetical protein
MGAVRNPFRMERGATGFRHVSEPPLPAVGLAACRAAWTAAARATGASDGEVREYGQTPNYFTATLTARAGEAHVALFHMRHPLIAFVEDLRVGYLTEFLDPPAWAGVLADHGFRILPGELLLSPLTAVDTSARAPTEWRQIEYWEPPTLGATLFNWWD